VRVGRTTSGPPTSWACTLARGSSQQSMCPCVQAPKGMKATFALFGIAGIVFAVISMAICLMLPFMFLNIAIM
jgi:hypothetical protein